MDPTVDDLLNPTRDCKVKKAHWKGVVFLILVALPAFSGSMLVTAGLPLLFFPQTRSIYRHWAQLVQGSYLAWIAVLNEWYCGVAVVVTGDPVLDGRSERVFAISNHRCRLDWMYLWSFFLRCGFGYLTALKIVLKASLKKAPVVGWAMQSFLFIFLQRKWEVDEAYTERLLTYLTSLHFPANFLIFPEGTDLHVSATEKSNKFGQENGWSPYKYVLHPRTKGASAFLEQLRSNLDALYDCTVAYVDYEDKKVERVNEMSLLSARFPKAVHVHVKRYAIADVPTGTDDFGKWVHERFAEKEVRLRGFYEEGKDLSGAPRSSDQKKTAIPTRTMAVMAVVAFGCVVAVTSLVYWLATCSLCRWFTLIWVVVNIIATNKGGLDLIELDLAAVSVKKNK